MTLEEQIKQLEANQAKLQQQINPSPMTNIQTFKYCAKGYIAIGLCCGLIAGYSLPQKETFKTRFKYGCGVGLAWPVIGFVMLAFTHR